MSKRPMRELGLWEHFRAVLHDMKLHHNVSISVRLHGLQVALSRLEDVIYDGLRYALLEHPRLHATILDPGTDHPHFSCLGKLNFPDCVSLIDMATEDVCEAAQLDEFLSRQNSMGFDGQALPLWRLVAHFRLQNQIITEIFLSFVWHHALGDGRSGLAVLASILHGVNKALVKEDTPSAKARLAPSIFMCSESDCLQVLPATLEVAIGYTRDCLREAFAESAATKPFPSVVPRGQKWAGGAHNIEIPVVTKVKRISFSADEVDKLRVKARQLQVTATPLLQTLACEAIFDTVPQADWLRCAVAIDLRPYFDRQLEISARNVGYWVSAFHIETQRQFLDQGKNSLLKECKRSAAHFEYYTASGTGDIDLMSLSQVGSFREMLLDLHGQDRKNSIGITNIGVCDLLSTSYYDFQDVPAFTSSEIVFSQSAHANGSALQFCIATMKDRGMSIVLCWQEGIIVEGLVSEIARRFHVGFQRICTD